MTKALAHAQCTVSLQAQRHSHTQLSFSEDTQPASQRSQEKREKKALNEYKGDDPKEGFQTQDEGGAAGAARRAHMHWGRKQEYYQPRF